MRGVALRIFPVQRPHNYVDDFNYVRPNGRVHHGIDIHAPRGTPIVAVDNGYAKGGEDPLGGHVVNLTTDDGTRFYYAHEDMPISIDGRVNAGDVLGVVGDSGNARGTDPHCHFEMHPLGGAAVDPYPYLRAAESGTVYQPPPKTSPWLGAIAILGTAGLAVFVIRSRT